MTTIHYDGHAAASVGVKANFARYLVPLGRVLLALIFVAAGPSHFAKSTWDYAARQGVPATSILVPIAGALALIGGLSVALGFYARIGALLLALFLIPVTLWMHAFWHVADPMMHQLQQVQFMKNVAIFGASLLLMYFGAGPISLDARSKTISHRAATGSPR